MIHSFTKFQKLTNGIFQPVELTCLEAISFHAVLCIKKWRAKVPLTKKTGATHHSGEERRKITKKKKNSKRNSEKKKISQLHLWTPDQVVARCSVLISGGSKVFKVQVMITSNCRSSHALATSEVQDVCCLGRKQCHSTHKVSRIFSPAGARMSAQLSAHSELM